MRDQRFSFASRAETATGWPEVDGLAEVNPQWLLDVVRQEAAHNHRLQRDCLPQAYSALSHEARLGARLVYLSGEIEQEKGDRVIADLVDVDRILESEPKA